jgi:hypothetical protein
VEVRGASENQRVALARESAFVELAAPPTRRRAEFRHTLRTPSAASETPWESGRRFDRDDAQEILSPAALTDALDRVLKALGV